MIHIPGLDGIRGIAILLVMFFHLHIPGFSLGWAGVPLFFVLSGFLITGILLEEKTEKFSDYLRSFYVKRTLRIFPLFYAYLAFNFIVLFVTGRPADGYGWYLLYLQNYHMGWELINNGSLPGIVGHTWSLAVEEQFYVVWPFLVYFLSRRQLALTCVLLIIASPIARWMILQGDGNVYMANVTLPSCLDMMAYGALLALLRTSEIGSKVAYTMFAVGCAFTGYAIFELGLEAFWHPEKWVKSAFYLYTALAFIFGLAIWSVAVKRNYVMTKMLTIKPLLFTGKISYGLYMWHFIIFIVVERLATKLKALTLPLVTPLLSLIVAYVVSILSFYFFEIHFLRFKDKWVAKNRSAKIRSAKLAET